eukprot:c49172_g1_i1 orf=320-538(-)
MPQGLVKRKLTNLLETPLVPSRQHYESSYWDHLCLYQFSIHLTFYISVTDITSFSGKEISMGGFSLVSTAGL